MDMREAMRTRHSVRRYNDRKIEGETLQKLADMVTLCAQESGLHIQLVTEEPLAFSSLLAKYGSFSGVRNYIVLAGRKSADLEERCGYYGEKIVLYAQTLGLRTCWAGLTYKKIPGTFELRSGEKVILYIAVGYSDEDGHPHRSKDAALIGNADADSPDWYAKGIEAVLLAPTAMNQQKFRFERNGEKVIAHAGRGFFTKADLGIAKYHFETASGRGSEVWL